MHALQEMLLMQYFPSKYTETRAPNFVFLGGVTLRKKEFSTLDSVYLHEKIIM